MADNTHQEPEHGSMDITEHVKTWLGFWNGVKWVTIGCVVVAILLAIFRT